MKSPLTPFKSNNTSIFVGKIPNSAGVVFSRPCFARCGGLQLCHHHLREESAVEDGTGNLRADE